MLCGGISRFHSSGTPTITSGPNKHAHERPHSGGLPHDPLYLLSPPTLPSSRKLHTSPLAIERMNNGQHPTTGESNRRAIVLM